MAVYIELVTEPFDVEFAKIAKGSTSVGAGLASVRRPLRGIEIKEDTHAYIKLMRVDGKEIPLFDSSAYGGTSSEYSNFILQSVQEQRMERHQIVETFGDTYLFLFGESPRFLNIQAVLLNSQDFNWKAEFLANYDKYLRGTRCVEMGARCYLFYDQNVVEGYILNASVSDNAQDPVVIPLQFQFFVTNYSNISLIGEGSDAFPIRDGAFVPEGVDLTESLNGEQLGLLLGETTGPTQSSFTRTVDRDRAIRGYIPDNTDEYTSPLQPTYDDLLDFRVEKERQEVEALDSALAAAMEGYGIDPADAQSPSILDALGVQPTFTVAGVGIGSAQGQAGASATFGATAGASFNASAGASAFAGAYAGVGGSAQAGAYAGTSAYASASASLSGSASVNASVTGQAGLTGRAGAYASAMAYANVSAEASAEASLDRYASASARASARAGGYAGANAYLGFQGGASVGASFAGAQGGVGASVSVGGDVSAFAFIAAPGDLKNVGVPPAQAMQGSQKDWSWSKSRSWPSA